LPEHPATADLRAVLEETLDTPVVRLERRPSEYRSSFHLEELDVGLEDGRELALMFKDVAPGSLSRDAQAAKPATVLDFVRELDVYELILEPAAVGTPVLHGIARERHWLFLERFDGVELYQVGERATWERVARWLARTHVALRDAIASSDRLLRYDAELLHLWPRRAAQFVARPELTRVAERYDVVVDRLMAMPATFLHGELYASNVLVDRGRVCAVDWEMAGFGPPLLDLAALVSGWSDEDRLALALAYRDAMPPEARPSEDVFMATLDACCLHVALQWLGWSPRWEPPEHHAQDWLARALELADRVGV
jgi:Phosphotransferase enzyme family